MNPKSHNILSFKIINVHVTCLNLRIVDSLNKYSDPQNTRILKGIDMVIVNNVPKKIACGGLCFKIAWNFINRAVINTFYMPNLKQPPTTRSRMQNTHIDSCALIPALCAPNPPQIPIPGTVFPANSSPPPLHPTTKWNRIVPRGPPGALRGPRRSTGSDPFEMRKKCFVRVLFVPTPRLTILTGQQRAAPAGAPTPYLHEPSPGSKYFASGAPRYDISSLVNSGSVYKDEMKEWVGE